MVNMLQSHKRNTRYHPKGATSLLIVVAMSLVFIVIISGLTALSIRESRQALSTDLSNRALAAAESYVKETAQEIIENPTLTDDICNERDNTIKLSEDAENYTEITCKTVSAGGTVIEREVDQDRTSIVYGVKGDYNMTFKWGKLETCEKGTSGPLSDYIDLDLAYGTYRTQCSPPAILELMFFSWQDSSLNAINGITPKTVLIMPKATVQEVNTGKPSEFNNAVTDNTCTSAVGVDGYQCSFKLDLSAYLGTNANSNVAILVRPRYKYTSYQAEFNKNGVPQSVQSNTALIDVTARVGDYYRRARGQVQLGSIQNTNAISDVLYSYEKICKRMTVGQDFAQLSNNECN